MVINLGMPTSCLSRKGRATRFLASLAAVKFAWPWKILNQLAMALWMWNGGTRLLNGFFNELWKSGDW